MSHERPGKSDEWYTPQYIFDALGVVFTQDVAGDKGNIYQCVPCFHALRDGLNEEWRGLIWMNPPFGGRNGLVPWVEKFIAHGDGIALVPDRTSAPWWQTLAKASEVICFVSPKVRFMGADGNYGKSPSNGVTLHGIGGGSFYVRDCGLGITMMQDKPTQ